MLRLIQSVGLRTLSTVRCTRRALRAGRPRSANASKRLLHFEALEGRRLLAAIQWPVQDGGNDHWYEFVPASLTWHGARTAATGSEFQGQPGHLVNITSSSENAFLLSQFGTGGQSQFAWIGGYEPLDDGVWRWADGPEANDLFGYSNWGGIEPNDNKLNEDYAMLNIGAYFRGIGSGQWADASPTPSSDDPVIGYIAEYESRPDIVAIDFHWDPVNGGVSFASEIRGVVPQNVNVALYWSDGQNPIGAPVYEATVQGRHIRYLRPLQCAIAGIGRPAGKRNPSPIQGRPERCNSGV